MDAKIEVVCSNCKTGFCRGCMESWRVVGNGGDRCMVCRDESKGEEWTGEIEGATRHNQRNRLLRLLTNTSDPVVRSSPPLAPLTVEEWGVEEFVNGLKEVRRQTRSEGWSEATAKAFYLALASLLTSPLIPNPFAIRFAHRRSRLI